MEGGFFSGDPDWAQNGISDFIRSYIKPDGNHYLLFITTKQLMWVIILFSQLFVIAYRQTGKKSDGEFLLMPMLLSIIGLTLFNLIFEARARYLFCYSPIYVILMVWGIRNVYNFLFEKKSVREDAETTSTVSHDQNKKRRRKKRFSAFSPVSFIADGFSCLTR